MNSTETLVPLLVGITIVLSAVVLPFQSGHNASAAYSGMMGTGHHLAKGQISNVQFDNTGMPAWIQSGIWVLRVNVGQNDDLQSTHLMARFAMVKPDGTAMHPHTMYNFKASEMTQEVNATSVLKGMATIAMKDGPVSDVPVTVKVFNNAVIGFWIGPDKVDGHFGTGPVYGTLSINSQAMTVETQSMNFVPAVNNPYYTLTPGTTFTYQSETDEGTEKNIVIVTNETKVVQGVTNVVVWDRVWLDDELIEETYDWFAQDKQGNVWYFGEDSREMEDGKVTSTEGSWEAGVDGAEAGIVMEAHPKVGDSYRQEYYKGHAEDMGDIVSLNETVTVPFGTFTDCLQTRDWSKIDPELNEYKYYCTDVGGLALEVVIDGGERVELISVE